MYVPTIDIIVPVWNSPFETRACLAAILNYSPEVRLIVIDNGSSRETELMLEEFSEPLGERALFVKSERNIGLVPALNVGLARSDSEIAIIVRPHVLVTDGWLNGLLSAFQKDPRIGVATPVFTGVGAPQFTALPRGCSTIETRSISFAVLALKKKMRMLLGGFDEGLDNNEWCLKDYVRRAWSKGYSAAVTSASKVECREEPVFGSGERRERLKKIGRASYLERWGTERHYAFYFGPDATAESLSASMEIILEGARQGCRFTLLLHRRQFSEFRRQGWDCLHSGIELRKLSLLMPQRDLRRIFNVLQTSFPDIIPVAGNEAVSVPYVETAIPFIEVASVISHRADNAKNTMEES